jgi:proline racemase
VARVQDGTVRSVRFRNVPAFVEAEGLLAEGLRADVAFGGAFYASVASPLPVQARNLSELIELGRAVKAGLEAQRSFVHPVEPELRDVYGVIFWARVDTGPPARQRNVTVFADGEVDRSPCGSGTSARLALLERAGELPRGEELVHEGIVGTEFRARVVGDADVAGRPAVITEVEGSAYRTGAHEFALDPDDPLGEGFLLR